MAQVLDIQTAGTTNAAANQALNGLKQDLQRVKNGKIQCDGKSFAASSIDSMQSRMACIERQMDGTAEAGLSQAKCKSTLKMVTDRLNNKLRVLAASLGYPVPKKMQLPRRLAMYEHLMNIAKGNNYEDTDKSVIGKTKLSSSSDLCVAIDVCSESQHKKLSKYWSAQLYRGQEYGHIEKEGTAVLPPGFVGKEKQSKSKDGDVDNTDDDTTTTT